MTHTNVCWVFLCLNTAACVSTSEDNLQPGQVNTILDEDGDGVAFADDCDDQDASVAPGLLEICDERDNDCDGDVDEGVSTTFYTDADGDGFGDPALPVEACRQPEGVAANNQDCDDQDADVRPDQVIDRCDGRDEDCDDQIDEDADFLETFADEDADGFGGAVVRYCAERPEGTTDTGGDCDDRAEQAYPGAEEVCDEIDNDCDEQIDEGLTTTFYPDTDGDGFGDLAGAFEACTLPDGAVLDASDCDDTAAESFPGAEELCEDDADNDCDGRSDEYCYADWEGEERFEYDFLSAEPGERNCTLHWEVAGTALTEPLCEGCLFGFQVDQTLDTERTENDGMCDFFDAIDGEPLVGDHDYAYAYHPDYDDGGEAILILLEGGEWYEWAGAALDIETGEMNYAFGDLDQSRDFAGGTVYYTYYFYGQALLE